MTTSLANISPNPSITPFTNGKSKLIASEANSAFRRVRVDKDGSKIAEVAVRGGSNVSYRVGGDGEGVAVRSGKDIEGKEDVSEDWISSHFCDSSVNSPCTCSPCCRRKFRIEKS